MWRRATILVACSFLLQCVSNVNTSSHQSYREALQRRLSTFTWNPPPQQSPCVVVPYPYHQSGSPISPAQSYPNHISQKNADWWPEYRIKVPLHKGQPIKTNIIIELPLFMFPQFRQTDAEYNAVPISSSTSDSSVISTLPDAEGSPQSVKDQKTLPPNHIENKQSEQESGNEANSEKTDECNDAIPDEPIEIEPDCASEDYANLTPQSNNKITGPEESACPDTCELTTNNILCSDTPCPEADCTDTLCPVADCTDTPCSAEDCADTPCSAEQCTDTTPCLAEDCTDTPCYGEDCTDTLSPAGQCTDTPCSADDCTDTPCSAADCTDTSCPAADCADTPCSSEDCTDTPCSESDCTDTPCPPADCTDTPCSESDCTDTPCPPADCTDTPCSAEDCSDTECCMEDCTETACGTEDETKTEQCSEPCSQSEGETTGTKDAAECSTPRTDDGTEIASSAASEATSTI
ncbi:hypothetical protein MSG28_000572 [Choristoneura fumiferana]|uniref:Uncharacterized protein n=1 Tax=Choristoneura fumiferana TaxID=7141 RepID=A0ACC0K1I3_CHOFU|nr:hypothetical protein MSG28_000572 [Choristoneura fumiferana]